MKMNPRVPRRSGPDMRVQQRLEALQQRKDGDEQIDQSARHWAVCPRSTNDSSMVDKTRSLGLIWVKRRRTFETAIAPTLGLAEPGTRRCMVAGGVAPYVRRWRQVTPFGL